MKPLTPNESFSIIDVSSTSNSPNSDHVNFQLTDNPYDCKSTPYPQSPLNENTFPVNFFKDMSRNKEEFSSRKLQTEQAADSPCEMSSSTNLPPSFPLVPTKRGPSISLDGDFGTMKDSFYCSFSANNSQSGRSSHKLGLRRDRDELWGSRSRSTTSLTPPKHPNRLGLNALSSRSNNDGERSHETNIMYTPTRKKGKSFDLHHLVQKRRLASVDSTSGTTPFFETLGLTDKNPSASSCNVSKQDDASSLYSYSTTGSDLKDFLDYREKNGLQTSDDNSTASNNFDIPIGTKRYEFPQSWYETPKPNSSNYPKFQPKMRK